MISFAATALSFWSTSISQAVALAREAGATALAKYGPWVRANPDEARARAATAFAQVCRLRSSSRALDHRAAVLTEAVANLPANTSPEKRAGLVRSRDELVHIAAVTRAQVEGYAALAGVTVADLDRCRSDGLQVEIGVVPIVIAVLGVAALLGYAASVYRDVTISESNLAMADKSIAAAKEGISLRDILPPLPAAAQNPVVAVGTVAVLGALVYGGWTLLQARGRATA